MNNDTNFEKRIEETCFFLPCASKPIHCDLCEHQAIDNNEMKVHVKTHENAVELFCVQSVLI